MTQDVESVCDNRDKHEMTYLDRHDAWKDSYDDWKLRSPDDDHPERCEHEVFEIGYDGIARCDQCSEHWEPSQYEIDEQRTRIVAYDRWCRRQELRERWFGWFDRLRDRIRVRMFLRRRGWKPLVDDDIPF